MGNFVLWFARLLVKFSSGKSSQIHEEKCQEKYQRKKNQKTATKRGKIPMSPATMETQVSGFRLKTHFFRSFSHFKMIAPVIFQKSDFLSIKSIDLRQYHESATEIMRSSLDASKSPAGWPRRHTFCPIDREIDWTYVTGPLVSINVWSCMVIRHQTTCGSISDHCKKNSKRRGAVYYSLSALATT